MASSPPGSQFPPYPHEYEYSYQGDQQGHNRPYLQSQFVDTGPLETPLDYYEQQQTSRNRAHATHSSAFPYAPWTQQLEEQPAAKPPAKRPPLPTVSVVEHLDDEEAEQYTSTAMRTAKFGKGPPVPTTQPNLIQEMQRRRTAPTALLPAISNPANFRLDMRPELLEGLRREPDPGSEEALLRTYRTRKEAAERSQKITSSSRSRPAIQEDLPALPAAVHRRRLNALKSAKPVSRTERGNDKDERLALEPVQSSMSPGTSLQATSPVPEGDRLGYFSYQKPNSSRNRSTSMASYGSEEQHYGRTILPSSSVSQREQQIVPENYFTSSNNTRSGGAAGDGGGGAIQTYTPPHDAYPAITHMDAASIQATHRQHELHRSPKTYQRYQQFAEHEYLYELERTQAGRGLPCFCCE